MSKYASLKDLEQVAKEYCKQMNYEFIFTNEYKFGFQDSKGGLWTMNYTELYEKLKEREMNNK